MAKKNFGLTLGEALAKSNAAEVVTGKPAPAPEPVALPAQDRAPEQPIRAPERPLDIVPVTIHVAPEDRKRLRQLSLDSGRSLQSLGIEAWTLLLESRGLPPLKPAKANVPDGRRRRPNGTAGT